MKTGSLMVNIKTTIYYPRMIKRIVDEFKLDEEAVFAYIEKHLSEFVTTTLE